MDKYTPEEIEQKWYRIWEENKCFSPDKTKSGETYSIVIPPPNVTGSLHIGHALDNTLQDILIRRQRMMGKKTLWLPGTDHAGIATQMVVERHLNQQGIQKEDLKREKFIEKVWEWKENYGGTIANQLRRLGASLDWERERFTLDEGLSVSVKRAFTHLYQKGLIYRGEYLVNWCPIDKTAISDLEVEYKEVVGELTRIAYPLEGGSGHVEIATTRPETLLGDTAVAVHPDDERYRSLIGRYLIVPLIERKIPIIGDEFCDPDFGTGAVKVTPAHDPNDFAIGNRHNLERINIFTEEAKINTVYPPLQGMERFDARKEIIRLLKEKGYWRSSVKHTHSVGHSQRQKAVVEPRLSVQWFCSMKKMAEVAAQAAHSGELKITPSNQTKIFLEWLSKIQDWCISRQLWWGHRIPAWFCEECDEIIVNEETPQNCPKCSSSRLRPEEDVLDTWFSSGLFPFSTMGWPGKTEDLKLYYPNSTLITGYDILFFWVARMVMLGIELTGKVPFPQVFTHGLVRDSAGEKMSKSRGNVIDPMLLIERYGADALRYTLCSLTVMGNDLKLPEKSIEESKFFINKIWNAFRFTRFHADRLGTPKPIIEVVLGTFDQWIIYKLHELIEETDRHWDNFRFHEASKNLYTFTWRNFCDWYLETIKPTLFGKMGEEAQEAAFASLHYVSSTLLRLLHPIMPFVTEELQQHLPQKETFLMSATYPRVNKETKISDQEFERAENIIAVISGIRNLCGENNIRPGQKIKAALLSQDQNLSSLSAKNKIVIETLSSCDLLINEELERNRNTVVFSGKLFEIVVDFSDQIDPEQEHRRLSKQQVKIIARREALQQKLANEAFLSKAPAQVVKKNKEELEVLNEQLQRLERDLAAFPEKK